jgi:hypothetical protein
MVIEQDEEVTNPTHHHLMMVEEKPHSLRLLLLQRSLQRIRMLIHSMLLLIFAEREFSSNPLLSSVTNQKKSHFICLSFSDAKVTLGFNK